MDYSDFEVQLGPNLGGKLLVRVLQAPLLMNGACEGQVDISALSASWRGSSRHLTIEGAPNQGWAEVGNLDSRFFETLFTGDVLELFSACLLNLPEKRGLRICLRINPGDSTMAPLRHVRWELLARKGQFLALSKRTPIVRTLQARSPRRVALFGSPTRVLLVASQPYGTATLALAEEIDRLRVILRKPRFELEVLENPDIRSFRSTLAKGNFHILHYMGHGEFDETSGDGVLLFHDAHAPARRAHAWHLATAVKDLRSLSLVILNACSTASYSSDPRHNPFAGLASSFLNSGIPCVVAMQSPIEDQQAIQLSLAFYENLAEGAPIEEAVTEARKAILDASPETADWSIPVLFLSTSDSPAAGPTKRRRALTLAVLIVAIPILVILSGLLFDWLPPIRQVWQAVERTITRPDEPVASAKEFLRLLAENKMTEAYQQLAQVAQRQWPKEHFMRMYARYVSDVGNHDLLSRKAASTVPMPEIGNCFRVTFETRYAGFEGLRVFESVILCREAERWNIVNFFFNTQPALLPATGASSDETNTSADQRALDILDKIHYNHLTEVYRDDVAAIVKAQVPEADFVAQTTFWAQAFFGSAEERLLLTLRERETAPCLQINKKVEMREVTFEAHFRGLKIIEQVIMIKDGDRWQVGCVSVTPSL